MIYLDSTNNISVSTPDNDVSKNAPTNDDLWTDSGNYATSFAGGDGQSEATAYQIATAEQLARLAYLINSSSNSTYNDLYYVQTADIDLSAHYWDPIGNYGSSSYYFRGNYNGGGYTISGLYTQAGSSSTFNYQGLFGYVYGTSSTSRAVIYDIVITESEIQGYQYVGGIAGYANYLNIFDCTNNATISAYSSVGGIVGSARNSEMYNCNNAGIIIGTNNYVGGIVGNYSSNWLYNCYNTADVSGYDYVGGIAGYKNLYENRTAGTNYCFNLGDISGNSYVGGIIGYNNRYAPPGSITSLDVELMSTTSAGVNDCYNRGNITAESNLGGICGYSQGGNITHCYNTGKIVGGSVAGGICGMQNPTAQDTSATIVYNCFNLGSVEGESIGAIVGYHSDWYVSISSDVRFSYWGGDCTVNIAASDSSGTNCGTCTVENTKTESWYTRSSTWSSVWDFENTWVIVEGANNGFPVLRGSSIIMTYHSNFGDDEIVSQQYDLDASVVIENGDLFAREGYNFLYWNTEANGGGLTFLPGDSYTGSVGLTLYAIWEEVRIFEITLDQNGGSGGTETIWLKYNDGYYSNNSATGSAITSLTSLPTRAGYSFNGYYTNPSSGNLIIASDGTIRANNTYFTANTTLYAQWTANNPAYYDEEGGYWYIENGRAPQSRVEDETLKTYLEENWDNLNNGTTYHFGGRENIITKIYNGEEYSELYGNYYLVEPIRWRLIFNENQEVGYGEVSEDGILAVMDKIIYFGRYAGNEISSGEGYSDMPISYLLNSEHPLISDEFLVEWTESMSTFGTTSLYGDSKEYTSKAFVSSIEEIEQVTGSRKVEFSDYVEALMVIHKGVIPLCYTRDLGSNYNNVLCLNENGDITQRKPNLTKNQLGVQFTIKISEYACVER